VRCKRVGEDYTLVSTTVEVPKPYVKEVWYGEGNLLIDAPGNLPGAFLCQRLAQLASPCTLSYNAPGFDCRLQIADCR
jgi:hypothetical protein